MCLGQVCELLAVPAGDRARVRSGGRELDVSLLTLDEPVAPGDWMLAHSGFALARLTAEEALDSLALRGSSTGGPA